MIDQTATLAAEELESLLATPHLARVALEKHGYDIPDEVFEIIFDRLFPKTPDLLIHFVSRDWSGLHAELTRLDDEATRKLPEDIVLHRILRLDIETAAERILLIRKLTDIAHQRRQPSPTT